MALMNNSQIGQETLYPQDSEAKVELKSSSPKSKRMMLRTRHFKSDDVDLFSNLNLSQQARRITLKEEKVNPVKTTCDGRLYKPHLGLGYTGDA